MTSPLSRLAKLVDHIGYRTACLPERDRFLALAPELLAVICKADDVYKFTKEPWDKDVDRGDAEWALADALAALFAAVDREVGEP